MSISFYWMFHSVAGQQDYAHVRRRFDTAMKREPARQALEAHAEWATDYDRLARMHNPWESEYELCHAFHSAFYLSAFERLAKDLVVGKLGQFELISVKHFARVSPVAILWWALGPSVTSKIPGMFGNILLEAPKLKELHQKITTAIRSIDREAYLCRAAAFATQPMDAMFCEFATDLRDALPKALEKASADSAHFVALSTENM